MSAIAQKPASSATAERSSGVRRGLLQRKCACGGAVSSGGECEECRKKKKGVMQRHPVGPEPAVAPPIVNEVLASQGQPLDAATRQYMEPRFGFDFGSVRVHTGGTAAQSTQAVNAHAYTVGSQIVFGSGKFAPQSDEGRQLLAHELTHVIQQASGAVAPSARREGLSLGTPTDAFEQQAEQTAARVASHPGDSRGSHHTQSLRPTNGGIVQRDMAAPRAAAPAAAGRARSIPIVENVQIPAAGQMTRQEFISTLRDTVTRECEAALAPYGRTANGCPYILRTISRYAGKPLSSLMRFIQLFARPPAGANAQALINATARQARTVAGRVAARRGTRVMSKAANEGQSPPPHDPVAIQSELGGGRTIEPPVRAKMEKAFGRNFEPVRIHTDGTAARISNNLGARAFAVGNDIAFASGEYRPGSTAGDMLLAHELAHTIQQAPGGGAAARSNDPSLERDADRAAAAVVSGSNHGAEGLREGSSAQGIQLWPAVVAGALIVAEVGTETAVVVEVAAVSSEIVVVESTLVVATEVAAPVVLEAAAPVALEAVAPVAVEATASASATYGTTAAVTATAVGASTISSDSGPQDQQRREQTCSEQHPTYPPCADMRTKEMVAESFANSRGIDVRSMQCFGRGTMSSIVDCGGGPGENWHCDINNGEIVVSLFGCFCCSLEGPPSMFWVPHESSGSDTGRAQRREGGRGERREQNRRHQERGQRRQRGGDDD